MTSILGVHFTPTHTGRHHYDFIRRTNPGIMKIVGHGQVGTPDVQIMADCYDAAPNAIHIYRNQPLSEQHDFLWRDPVGCAVAHVATLASELALRVEQAAQRGLRLPDRDQWRILGINEPVIELFPRKEDMSNYDEWLPMVEGRAHLLDLYMSTFMAESDKHDFRCGVGNFSGGQPANRRPGEYATYDWFPLTRKALEASRGRHFLSDHEYWDIQGPEENPDWWTWRWKHCDWDCDIMVLESGVDRQIRSKHFEGNRGWQGHMTPAQYVDQHRRYMRGCLPDSRFKGATPFTLDGAKEWWSFYIEPCMEEMIALAAELSNVKPSPRPVETHIPAVGTGSPSATPVPPLAHPLGNSARRVVTQGFGDNPQDYARLGLAGHNGIDFAVPSGTPIGAVDSGVVLESRLDADGYGEYIKLRHSWGESLYAHLSTRKVEAGEAVNRGSIIGRSGNTGNSTGPHLHFAIRINPYQRGWPFDGFSDPLPYLDAAQPVMDKKEIVKAIGLAALEFDVDPDLLLSQAWAESSFDPKAISHAGAKGLFQIMPPTWDEWAPKVGASNPFDAVDSARVGAAYMQWLLQQTQGNAWRALVAYGWGIGNVIMGEVPPATWTYYANKIIHGRDLLRAVGA